MRTLKQHRLSGATIQQPEFVRAQSRHIIVFGVHSKYGLPRSPKVLIWFGRVVYAQLVTNQPVPEVAYGVGLIACPPAS